MWAAWNLWHRRLGMEVDCEDPLHNHHGECGLSGLGRGRQVSRLRLATSTCGPSAKLLHRAHVC